MKKRMKRMVIIVMAFAVTFTSLPIMTGEFAVHAATAKKPVKVERLRATKTTQTAITIKWNRVLKNTKGYAVYVNGKHVADVSAIKTSYKITKLSNGKKLKAGTKYKISVKAFNKKNQKQYYNAKTKRWATKKPAKKNWKADPKTGKKQRSVTKYVYGPASAAVTIKTSATVQATDNDTWFTKSSLPASETYDYAYQKYVTYTINSKGSVSWKSDNTSVATVSYTSPGDTCKVTFKKAGTAKITATSALNGKSKTVALTVTDSTPSGDEEDDGGIGTPYGKIYPNADGSFTLTRDGDGFLELNGVRISGEVITDLLPMNSIVKVDASQGINNGVGDSFEGVIASMKAVSHSSSHPSVVYIATWRSEGDISGMDLWHNGLVFVSAGESVVTFDNGHIIKFAVTGENSSFKGYLNYINSMVSAVSSKSNYEKVSYWTGEIRKFAYKNYQSAYDVYNYAQGDCWGGNNLLIRLCNEAGIYARLRDAGKESSSGSHRNTHVVIDGTDYIVDATPEDGSVFETWESYKTRRGLSDNDL